jgi:hypothetical protein
MMDNQIKNEPEDLERIFSERAGAIPRSCHTYYQYNITTSLLSRGPVAHLYAMNIYRSFMIHNRGYWNTSRGPLFVAIILV